LIMTHGDDDGLRVPPQIAPWQIVIVPMLRDNDEDSALIDYCQGLRDALVKQSAFGEPLRVLLDLKATKAATKRWGWIKKGAPIVIEVGGRDMAGGNVTLIRRDALYREDGKLDSAVVAKADCIEQAAALLIEIQQGLYNQAKLRLDGNIATDIVDLQGLEAFFADSVEKPGWVLAQWSKPSGAELDKVEAQLKALKLTLRNTPRDAAPADGPCIFTGAPAVERVLIARAY
ncbi:MAG: His/Gly/Thr/Pro-type tRNA ligase C-terminal domain-containing protein, partial [Sphingomonas sp.]|uniref:His/Gly/Thr/Pro-type tRNA ligase C-terminal domain-containing protein n=1 Tax=Sphingomonas sp. TaxID=28214 RepID=UPI003F7D652A